MSLLITCPCCRQPARVPRDWLGRLVQCPKCRHTLSVSVACKAPTRK
jgi:hypothetical protein